MAMAKIRNVAVLKGHLVEETSYSMCITHFYVSSMLDDLKFDRRSRRLEVRDNTGRSYKDANDSMPND